MQGAGKRARRSARQTETAARSLISSVGRVPFNPPLDARWRVKGSPPSVLRALLVISIPTLITNYLHQQDIYRGAVGVCQAGIESLSMLPDLIHDFSR